MKAPSPPRRDLVFVSAGLELDGGGRALAGRLLATASAAYARERGIGWSLLSLGGLDGFAPGGGARAFAGRQGAMALAVWRRQLAAGRGIAFVYDLLGPARAQAWLPAPLRAPYLVALYGIEVWRRLSGSRSRALRQATVRLATSSYTVAGARAANRDFGPVEVLPLCLEERPPAGETDGALLDRAGRDYLLIVGRMAASERYKGHEQLLHAMTRLPGAASGANLPTRLPAAGNFQPRLPAAASVRPRLPAAGNFQPRLPAAGNVQPRLVIAGDGDDRLRLEALAASLGLSDRVLFTGFVSEATLAELYARAAVFVMPSRGEGFGLVYLEAMRAGRPCVAARASAAEEIVADGETGLLVDPLDPDAIAGALGRLLAAPDLARAMGEGGRRRLERLFTPRRFRERLWPLLDRLTGVTLPSPAS
ncbi:MAG TPA: glycosyltransferase family 4 protein [Thermoanaerobaculia bacterium]|jgi:phosphatidylinositol alpha-1,6-mannosyltransferase|nr:glycosyltransferase family 4 protein [Thermoanaerobaculia bacterium]